MRIASPGCFTNRAPRSEILIPQIQSVTAPESAGLSELKIVCGFSRAKDSGRASRSWPAEDEPGATSPCLPRGEKGADSLGNRGEAISKPADPVQGTLGMLLLKIPAREPLNGFAISERLGQVSADVLQVPGPTIRDPQTIYAKGRFP
jgi:hypothetical protein